MECERGGAALEIEVAPRFDYGAVRPWLRRAGSDLFTAIGGDDGLLMWSDGELAGDGKRWSRAARYTPASDCGC